MNKKIVAAAFFLSLVCFMIIGSASAQTLVGVHQGNMFKYSLVVNWSSTNPNDTVPADLYFQNRTEYFQVNVQTVTSTTVWIEAITHYSEEYEINSTQYVDVNTGEGNCTFVYAADLTRGNYLFPGSTSLPWVVNETIPRYYQDSGFRQTNHISVNRTDIEGQTYSLMNLYFDQATGMVVESYYTYVNTATPQQTVTQYLQLIESNVWAFSPSPSPSSSPSSSSSPSTSASPTPTQEGTTPSPTPNEGSPIPIDPLIIVLVLVVVIVLVIAVLVTRRGGKKSQKQPSTQAPSAPATAAAQTKLICGKCGQENPKGSEFCNKCGAKLPD
jgi:ribosomal protein L40E